MNHQIMNRQIMNRQIMNHQINKDNIIISQLFLLLAGVYYHYFKTPHTEEATLKELTPLYLLALYFFCYAHSNIEDVD